MSVATSFRADQQKIEALDDLLEHQAWFVREVMDGIAEAGRGEFATEDEVSAVFRKYKSRP